MVYDYPFWEEVLVEIDDLENLNITLNDLSEEDALEPLDFTLIEIDNEIDGLESLDELNFNLTEINGLEDLNFNLTEIIELENLNEGNNTNTNNNKKRFILID
jgi:hypothetical protein